MKKHLLFFLLIPLLSFSIFTGCASKKPVKLTKEDYSNLRVALSKLHWRNIALSPKETLVVFTDGGWGSKKELKFIIALHSICETNGGRIYNPTYDKYLDTFLTRKGNDFIIKNVYDLYLYFGIESPFICKGGNLPFKVKMYKGYEKYFRSIQGSYYVVIADIVTSKELPPYQYGFFTELEKYKNISLEKFLKELNLRDKRINPDGSVTGKFSVAIPSPNLGYNPEDIFDKFLKVAEFCRAHNGDLVKKTDEGFYTFGAWLKDIMINHEGVLATEEDSYIAGIYYCLSETTPFKVHLELPFGRKVFFPGYITHKITIFPGETPGNIDKSQIITPEKINTYLEKPVTDISDRLALEVAKTKNEIIKNKGNIQYRGIFIDEDETCKYVSLIFGVPEKKLRDVNILNYKICNNEIFKKLPTTFEKLPKESEKYIKEAAVIAQKRGYSKITDPYGYTFIGVPLRDFTKCKVEVRILKGHMLLELKELNACNIK